MNKFFLPKLKKITIEDYSLYKCPFVIEFSSKLNIIYGTNGTGKSTLLMLILFSLVGLYRGGIKTRSWKDQRRDNRPIFKEDFFRARSPKVDKQAKIISEFNVKEDKYIVEHSLVDGKLISVFINDKALTGKVISYKTYEEKFTKSREKGNNDTELKDYLIYKYQEEIRSSTKLPGGINTLINMLLDVMFFDEGRKFAFWNSDLQETVIGKYIVDTDFYEEYCDRKLETKSLESFYKKKSETLNYMSKVIKAEKEKEKEKNQEIVNEIQPELDLLKLEDEILSLKKVREELQKQYNIEDKRLIVLSKEKEIIKEKMEDLSKMWYENLLPDHYNEYYEKFSNKMSENICPVCGTNHRFEMKIKQCIFCKENLEIKDSVNLIEIDIERKDAMNLISQKNQEIDFLSNKLKLMKENIDSQKRKIEEKIRKKNLLEAMTKPNLNIEDKDSIRLEEAKIERGEALKAFNESKKKEEEMKEIIENSLVNNFKEFSYIFAQYADSFFGEGHKINISLPFKNDNDLEGLLIKFTLDESERSEAYMLSESQRIFTDLSFRFSILTTFHNESFFMCETPDSTLDMFREMNAVKTFKTYINNGNSLILTANARKSNLISMLYNEYEEKDITVIDLTKISIYSNSLNSMGFEEYLEKEK